MMYSKLKLLYDNTELDELSIIPGNHMKDMSVVSCIVKCGLFCLPIQFIFEQWLLLKNVLKIMMIVNVE